MKKIILSLSLVLLISGCVGMPFDIPFLSDQGGPNVTELGPDILVIQNINVIPNPPLSPDDRFSVYFEVKNQDENERVPQAGFPDVSYELYDTGLCSFEGGDPRLKSGTWSSGFAPLETKLVEWNFKAPSVDEIVHLSTSCPIKFKINYDYTAKSQIDVSVIDEERLRDLQRSGEDTTYIPSLSVGRGPVKIYFDFGNILPVRENSELPVYIKVMDKGAGLLGKISRAMGRRLVIKAPDFQGITCIEDYFICFDTNNDGNNDRCENTLKDIPLIRKETFEIRCVLTTPGVSIENTYYITAELHYEYPVLGETNVRIEPR
jgi:hypothetical protein